MKHIKRITILIGVILLLSGCGKNNDEIEVVAEGTESESAEESHESLEKDVIEDSKIIDYDWETVIDRKIEHQTTVIGYYDLDHAISVGFSGSKQYSNDGGTTWTDAENASLCRFGMAIYDEQTMISCGNGGQNRLSTDGGKTWQALGDFPLVNAEVNRHVYMIDKETIWIGSRYAIGLSTNGGASFISLALPMGVNQLQTIFFNDTNIGYVVSTDGHLYKTTDACTSYELIGPIVDPSSIYEPEKGNGSIYFYDDMNGIYLYTSTDYTLKILRTSDGGLSWNPESVEEIFTPTIHISRDGQLITCFTVATKEVKVLRYG